MFCNNCGKEFKEAHPVCDQCGAPLAPPNASVEYQPPVAPSAPQGNAPKKKSNKAVMIAVIAVVLVIAIVCGIIFIPKLINKEDSEDENSTSAQNANSVYDSAPETPQGKTFDAATTTLFDSEEIDFSVVIDGEKVVAVDIDFGENLEDSVISFEVNIEGETTKYMLKNSMLTLEYMGESVEVTFDEFLTQSGLQEYIEEFELETGLDLFKVVDTIINNGLDLNEIAGLVDDELIAYAEQELVDYYDVNADIPDAMTILEIAADFIDNGISEEALKFEETSGNNGTTYSVSVNLTALFEDIGEYVKNRQELRDLVQLWIDYEYPDGYDYDGNEVTVDYVVDKFVEYAIDDYGYSVSRTAEITVKDGRITNVTILDDSEELVNVTINSK